MINEINYKDIIRKGIITNYDLVEMFGNEKNKEQYKLNNKLGSMKNTLLNRANKYCNIKDISKGQYKITYIYNIPIPTNINKLLSGLYKYMSPLILLKLKEKHDQNNKIVLPFTNFANNIYMINGNYKPIKYNKIQISENNNIDIDIINDFYEKVDDSIKHYLQTCLGYLKAADVIEFFNVPMIHKRKIERVSKHNSTDMDYQYCEQDRRATSEEVKIVIEIQESIRKELGIKNKSECYYGKKSYQYNQTLNYRLLQKDIIRFYNAYEVYYTNIDRLNKLLNNFKYKNKKELIKQLNNEFINIIVQNAGKRYEDITKNLSEDYIPGFIALSDMTIPYDAEKIQIIQNEDECKKRNNNFKINIERGKDNYETK